tara:strand:+ start:343 stop:474 length:132 start_codon:yes stop_codon:yes gene_type:complete
MNKENASKLWKMIQEAGDFYTGTLSCLIIETKTGKKQFINTTN